MKLSDVKSMALKLVNLYSEDGVQISTQDNADFLNKMNQYINAAQMELCRVAKIPATTAITLTKAAAGAEAIIKKTLPADFMDIHNVKLGLKPFKYFKIDNMKNLYISNEYAGTLDVNYYKYPTEIIDTTADTTELEIDKDAQPLVPYYVASLLCAEDNRDLSMRLLSMYNDKLTTYVSMRYPKQQQQQQQAGGDVVES